MVDCKDYKKGIRQLEWYIFYFVYIFSIFFKKCSSTREHRKMSMTIEDYITKQRDITYLRLSREVQDVNTKKY